MNNDKLMRYEAVIDWIEIEVETKKRTNFFTILRHSDLCHVKALNTTAGSAASTFRFKVYDIASWESLKKTLEIIEEKFPLIVQPKVTAIEIAFDAYSLTNTESDLVNEAADFYKFLANPVNENRRFAFDYVGSPKNSYPSNHNQVLTKLRDGWTGYVGSQKHDDACHRIYVKKTDHTDQKLKVNNWRSRVEITLKGNGCPFADYESASNYNFTKFARWFKFRKLKDDLDPLMQTTMNKKAHVGLTKPRRRKAGGMRKNARTTRADLNMNRITYEALRNLTKRLG